jgi:peptidoglycan/LPS O-acetylase OafA/YrhL
MAVLMVFAGHVALFGKPVRSHWNPITAFFAENRGVGVDLFFVLSGFLITGILYDSKTSAHFFRRFFTRRTLRIFPLYYAALATVTIGGLLLPHVQALATVSPAAQLANWTYTSNFLIAFRGWNVEPLFLIPFWSLAVEEQFYVLWPFIVQRLGRTALLRACIIGIAAAFILRLLFSALGNPVAAYTLFPSRMDALLVGAVIALVRRDTSCPPPWMSSRALFAACWLLFAVDLLSGGAEYRASTGVLRYAVHFTIASLAFGTLLLTLVERRHSLWLALIMESGVARFFGKYSYAIYVVHVAVITALPGFLRAVSILVAGREIDVGPALFTIIALSVSVLLALMSWHLIERPCLAFGDRIAPL